MSVPGLSNYSQLESHVPYLVLLMIFLRVVGGCRNVLCSHTGSLVRRNRVRRNSHHEFFRVLSGGLLGTPLLLSGYGPRKHRRCGQGSLRGRGASEAVVVSLTYSPAKTLPDFWVGAEATLEI